MEARGTQFRLRTGSAMAPFLAFLTTALLAVAGVTCADGEEPDCRLHGRPSRPSPASSTGSSSSALPGVFPHLKDDFPELSIRAFAEPIESAVVQGEGLTDIPAFKKLLLESRSEPRAVLVLPTSLGPPFGTLAEVAEVCQRPRRLCVILEAGPAAHRAQAEDLEELLSLGLPYFSVPRGKMEVVPAKVDRDRLGTETGHGVYVFAPGGELIWFCPWPELRRAIPVLDAVLAALGGLVLPDLQTEPAGQTEPPEPPGLPLAPAPALLADLPGQVMALYNGGKRAFSASHVVQTARERKLPVLISFWATHCAPCVLELPELADLERRYSGKLLVVGLLTEGRDQPTLERLRTQVPTLIGEPGSLRLQYVLLDDALTHSLFGEISEHLALPTFALFDRRGQLVDHFTGAIKGTENGERIERFARLQAQPRRKARPKSRASDPAAATPRRPR